jgi:hypothetical protein
MPYGLMSCTTARCTLPTGGGSSLCGGPPGARPSRVLPGSRSAPVAWSTTFMAHVSFSPPRCSSSPKAISFTQTSLCGEQAHSSACTLASSLSSRPKRMSSDTALAGTRPWRATPGSDTKTPNGRTRSTRARWTLPTWGSGGGGGGGAGGGGTAGACALSRLRLVRRRFSRLRLRLRWWRRCPFGDLLRLRWRCRRSFGDLLRL